MLYTEIPSQRPDTPLLNGIDHPQQLRQLEPARLTQVADELRLLDKVVGILVPILGSLS